MVQELGYLKETPSQTAGPYVHIGLTPNYSEIGGVYESDLGSAMVNDKTLGERITVTGRVLDGGGAPVKDAVLEIWQADSAGLYNSPSELRGTADPNFTGWGRCPTNSTDGVFRFETIKPGRVPFKDGRKMAPHITFWIVARGINIGLHTRMYFPEETAANAEDPLLARIEHRDRVATLIAAKEGSVYTFDVHLQGDKETVFLDI
ncbi:MULTISPECIES: protocatechuate 3,4-dioxygenase subunit alpha [unclassified Rhizobium]|jgi:protocatechuate 3,4-dioxygenase alpha subunit|uniref:protocatechuate 3,4-dioxygenase subunit alpha n=1 Tax=unclassified Rhizobium TaxID=2613769 RepID=UPI00064666B1|nr:MULTISPECIES: protocatechuate 3,4-dioxygenase subunit alpha [unclassified Rhizobium]MBN8953038.1 protocatechuate 3,4-dioxygenase subunit alpha [Rhizobium tropici]OJY64634.1 MAG: protocatechuate 3,4-dioxygenase subunit alpha [Rhizobium sp. 60-20]RKD72504.1 protocatechuate 3,4-dioxygenase alpha subunit [Rhizobium sp. WW_1]